MSASVVEWLLLPAFRETTAVAVVSAVSWLAAPAHFAAARIVLPVCTPDVGELAGDPSHYHGQEECRLATGRAVGLLPACA